MADDLARAGSKPSLACGVCRGERRQFPKADLPASEGHFLAQGLTKLAPGTAVAISKNVAARGMRPIGIGRKNWLFAGSDTGGEPLTRAMIMIETAKMNGLDPQVYLTDILNRMHDHRINRLDELLPWNWNSKNDQARAA